MDSDTIEYYNNNAANFIENTVMADMHINQQKFLSKLQPSDKILDFGCGSGRDTRYFLEQGYCVEAMDGSEELCRRASKYTGIDVKHMYFQELDKENEYDGIWACASILHLSYHELKDVLVKMGTALKNGGVVYTSFKYGDFEGKRNGRYFTDRTENSLQKLVKETDIFEIEEFWVTSDVRPEREDERWLNTMLRKKTMN